MFDTMIEGADKYVTDSSMWLIFTEEKRWVIEFTNTKTLWFNYNLFHSELKLLSMDCVDSKDIIKEWFESRFLGIDAVEETLSTAGKPLKVEDTIQNGVKHTDFAHPPLDVVVEDTIQNGVKDTHFNFQSGLIQVEDVIQNGVRQTNKRLQKPFRSIKDAIQNGVKETKKSHWIKSIEAEDIIENGICDVKHSYDFEEIVVKDIIEDSYPHKHRVEGVIKNTVKDGI